MIIGVPTEIMEGEHRVAALPETVARYRALGFEVVVQAGAGDGVYRRSDEYRDAGAAIVDAAEELYRRADVVLKVKQPMLDEASGRHEAESLRAGSILISFLHPAAPASHAMVKILCERRVTAFTMDGVPRTSRAQPMDALTSMSTITGYRSVIEAAHRLPRFVPVMATAIGTIQPARVLVVGSGVVGLQAIATAKRLGAVVTAVDIRPEARREAGSLKGTNVAGFDVPAELAVGEGGYARALPAEWLQRERELLRDLVRGSDVAILSALVPGEEAPMLIDAGMVRSMRPGSVIVDVAIDQGGNCELTRAGRETMEHEVWVQGTANIPGSMAVDATWLYANNVLHYVENLFRRGPGSPDLDDPIVRATLVTMDGAIVHAGTLKAMAVHGGRTPCGV